MQQILGPAAPPHSDWGLLDRLRDARWTLEDLALAVRWVATGLAAFGAWYRSPVLLNHTSRGVGAMVIIGYAGIRTFVPISATARPRMAVITAVIEVALYSAVAATTGGWASPFALCASAGLVLAGLLGGWRPLAFGTATVTAFTIAGAALGRLGTDTAGAAVRVLEVALTGVVGAYCRRLFIDQVRSAGELDFLRSANEVHSLLLDLHARAAMEPWALTLRGTVAAVVDKLREQVPSDLVVVMLADHTAEADEVEFSWQVVAAEGLRLPPHLTDSRLPLAARRAQRHRTPQHVALLAPGDGLDARSYSGVYAPLWARHELIGLLIVERRTATAFSDGELDIVARIARHAGLAVDNTRWFARLRRLGAEMERDRIARELHDRVGQSLAAVALTMDRMSAELPSARPELERLSSEIRSATRQIREKLSDMRTEPGPSQDLSQLLPDFLDRVAARSGLAVSFDHEAGPRLTVAEELEVWRIAQEAVINAERHAEATRVEVRWKFDGDSRVLEVRDNGKGIHGTAPLRRDAYGMLGMRERAEILGAGLKIDSRPGHGTSVRLRLGGKGK